MKNYVVIALVLLSVIGCSKGNQQPILVDSNGRMNGILVVINHDLWTGLEGAAVKEIIQEPVLGLPQNEPHFNSTQIPVNAYKNMFLRQRNVLHVSISDSLGFRIGKNVYAQPQTIVTVTAPDSEQLISELEKRKDEIVQTFRSEDLKAVQRRLKKTSFSTRTFETLSNLGIDLLVPDDYKMVDDTGDFLWLRKHILEGQTMNILVYELPINSEEDEAGAYINSVRDTIGKQYIPGTFEDSYYITEQAYTPHTFNIELDGLKTYETRGKWELKNDFMAGPFLNYTMIDKANNRLVVLEGFTYAPSTAKRDFMFELEAVLKTVKLN